MIGKIDAKDWVREVIEQARGLGCGPKNRIELESVRTGKGHFDHIGRDYCDDDFFWSGYEAMQAEDGFMIVGIEIAHATARYGYLENP